MKKSTHLLKFLFVLLFALFVENSAQAQNCNCTYTVGSETTVDNATLNLPPGSVICIPAGVRTSAANSTLTFKNFISEDPSLRYVFKNCGGQAIIRNTKIGGTGEPVGTGIAFDNCKNFKLTGSGDASFEFGILVDGQPLAGGLNGPKFGVSCGGKSTDFEIDRVKVTQVLFGGFMIKTDPTCSNPDAWRGSFTMRNVSIHDNMVDTTQRGEGFYIGYSFYSKPVSCGGTSGYGHAIQGLRVYNNKAFNTASEGIQVGSADSDCEVYDNEIRNYGLNPLYGDIGGQGNALQLGDGTTGLCYNNFMKAPSGIETAAGMKVFGINNRVFNNIIVNPSRKGIYADENGGSDRGPGSGYRFYNNTIINPGQAGIYLVTDEVENNWVKNNIIVKEGGTESFIHVGAGVSIDSSNNYLTNSMGNAKFVAPQNDDYHLTSTSPAIDNGVNLYSEQVTIDFDHVNRPASGPFEQGVYEYGSGTPPPSSCAGTGQILREYWTGIQGNQVSLIPVNETPDGTEMLTSFSGPTNGDQNYGARISGYVCAPATGSYTFWISSNDHSELWLSTDDNPANKVRVAYLDRGLVNLDWDAYPYQKSAPIQLVEGQRYYIEALHKQGIGTDHVAVGWQLPDGTYERPIPGNRLIPYGGAGTSGRMAMSSDTPSLNKGETTSTRVTIQVFNSQGHFIQSMGDIPMPQGELRDIRFREMISREGLYIFRVIDNRGRVSTKKVFLK